MMCTRPILRWGTAFIASMLLPFGALSAQTCTTGTSNNSSCRIDINISSTIQATRRLVVSPGTSFSLTPSSGQLSADDYNAGGFDASGSLQVLVQSNAPWRVTVRSLNATLTGTCTNKSANSIFWGTSAGTRTIPLSTTETTVFSGTAPTVGLTRDVFLRVGLDWLTDGPVAESSCTLPLSFSVSAP